MWAKRFRFLALYWCFMKGIGWFSGGVTSAVAIKKAIDSGAKMEIIYFETGSHHPDHIRFIADCESWYNQKIIVMQDQRYSDHIDMIKKVKYVNGPSGAKCTKFLKKDIRITVEKFMAYDFQIFGFEYELKQIKRAKNFRVEYPKSKSVFPLIKARMTKHDCLKELVNAGIEIPAMYKLGYSNSNCIGCVKGGAGYWNKIRVDFPETFDRMAKAEREVNATCLKKSIKTANGKNRTVKIWLDELNPLSGRHEDISLPECGVICPVEGY